MPLLFPIVDCHEIAASGSVDAPDASFPLNVRFCTKRCAGPVAWFIVRGFAVRYLTWHPDF
jgi:hypothetical protein